jgi:hypothetical protein
MNRRRQQAELRKRSLRMRAALERIELEHYANELRATLGWSGLFRNMSRGMMSARALPFMLELAKRLPFAGALARLALRHIKGRGLLTALRAGAIGVLVWQGIALLRATRGDARRSRH